MRVSAWLTMAGIIVLLVLLPLLFAQVMAASLLKLYLSPAAASLVVIGIILGGLINIPVHRILHDQEITLHPFAILVYPTSGPRCRRSAGKRSLPSTWAAA